MYSNYIVLALLLGLPAYMYGNESSQSNQHEVIFRQLFKQRRAQQISAVNNILALKEGKQTKMVMAVAKTIFDVIFKNLIFLEHSGYTPGISEFPEKEPDRDALALVLENTALMGDIVLRLPEVGEKALRSTPEWMSLFVRSLTFVNQTQLLDKSTTTLMYLVGQELNLTGSRDPDYINPYRKPKKDATTETNKGHTKKVKKKLEIKRGPRLSSPQIGEL